MKPCQDKEELIAGSISNGLGPREQRELEEHLGQCEGCAAYRRLLSEDDALLTGLAHELKASAVRARENAMGRIRETSSAKPRSLAWKWARGRGSRLAGAALAAAAVMIAVLLIYKPALTMADVIKTFAEQPWVHIRYDNARELWVSLRDGKTYFKGEDGRVCFVDASQNTRLNYWPILGSYIAEDKPADRPSPWNYQTAWDYAVQAMAGASDKAVKGPLYERHDETVDGRKLVRFDSYFPDAMGKKIMRTQVWVDPQSRLPVRTREFLVLADREQQKRDSIEGIFEFPQTGPSSLFDLGVPRNLKIVKTDRKTDDPRVEQILSRAKEIRSAFPRSFRAVQWPDKSSEIDIVHWKGGPVGDWWRGSWAGVGVRLDHYFNLGPEHGEYYLPIPTSVPKILEWAGTQVPVNVLLWDGEKSYHANGPFPKPVRSDQEPYVHVNLMRGDHPMDSNRFPQDYQWPYLGQSLLVLLEHAADLPADWQTLRTEKGDVRSDYVIDTAHDFICVRWTWWKQKDGHWLKEREEELADLAKLPGEAWYARKKHITDSFGNRNGWNIDIEVLKPDQFPPDIFNGEKLLSRYKKIETY